MTNWVRIAQGPIDFEEELEHASVLLEEVRDEAVAVVEQAQAVVRWTPISKIWTDGCEI